MYKIENQKITMKTTEFSIVGEKYNYYLNDNLIMEIPNMNKQIKDVDKYYMRIFKDDIERVIWILNNKKNSHYFHPESQDFKIKEHLKESNE